MKAALYPDSFPPGSGDAKILPVPAGLQPAKVLSFCFEFGIISGAVPDPILKGFFGDCPCCW
jgi:hypothetical protein